MTNVGQGSDKSMLIVPAIQSTKAPGLECVPLIPRLQINFNRDPYVVISESDFHDEDLYTYKNFGGAKFSAVSI